jgi:phage shock protein E
MIKAGMAVAAMAIGSCALVLLLAAEPEAEGQPQLDPGNVPENPAIQFGAFVSLAKELQVRRESRRIPISTFAEMSKDPDTIILDTRSRDAYEDVHVDGAIHLNFSDFTDDKLRECIPSKETRILIYCNNNFISAADSSSAKQQDVHNRLQRPAVKALADKRPALALNIPTFINLHGYGYENVYELADRIHVSDTRITLVGKFVDQSQK